MFQPNKTSQTVTVTPDMTVADYERQLGEEGFTGGYRPYAGYQVSLNHCLDTRMPNLYFLKHGGIEDLCVGGEVVTPLGHVFDLTETPRSATGIDLKKAIIGSQARLGSFRKVVLKVFPISSKEQWCLALYDKPKDVKKVLTTMLGLFIRPLFVKVLNQSEAQGLLISLNLNHKAKTVLAFKLTGLNSLVNAEQKTMIEVFNESQTQFYMPTKVEEQEILNQTLITPESHDQLITQCAPLIGSDSASQRSYAESELKKFLKEDRC